MEDRPRQRTPVEPRTARGARIRGYFEMTRGRGAIAELDGVRAIAILLVLFRHAAQALREPPRALWPIGGWDAATVALNGWTGVDLFFVLSGFLITHHVCRRYPQGLAGSDLTDYFKRRVLRIVPAYYAVLLAAVIGLFPYYQVAAEGLGQRVAYHLLFLQDYLASNIVVVFWSLGVEEKFYLLAPVLLTAVFALRSRRLQYASVATLMALPLLLRALTEIAQPGVDDYARFFAIFRSPFHLSFDGLATGMLCALFYRDRELLAWTRGPRAAQLLYWSGGAGVVWLLGRRVLLDEVGLFDKLVLQSALALAMGAFVLAVLLGGGPARWLRAHWMMVVSKLSYSLYLVHFALIPLVQHVLHQWPRYDASAPGLRLLVFLPVFAVVSAAGASLLHYVVEKPFLLIKDRTVAGQRREAGTAAGASARVQPAGQTT
jgi:peptidoglycan/LPS O-acetylase OafA/YrhL